MSSLQPHLQHVARIIDRARDAFLDQEEHVHDWAIAAALSTNPNTVRQLERYVSVEAIRTQLRGVPFYQPNSFSAEDFHPTRVIGFGFARDSGFPALLNVDDFCSHMTILGSTNAGKTTCIRFILLQVAPHAKLFIVESEKQDMRPLVDFIPGITVINARTDLAWNFFQVHEGLTPELTVRLFIQDFSRCFGLMVGSQSLLQAAVHKAFAERGIFEGSRNFVTLREVREIVAKRKVHSLTRSGSFKDSILNRIDGMLFESPNAYDYRAGIPIERLASSHVLIETDGLNPHHARFLLYSILRTLYLYRLRTGQRGNTLRNLCCVDEAGAFFAPRIKDQQPGWTPLADLISRAREAGLGFLLSSQSTDVDDALLKNTRTRLVFRLADGRCVNRVAQSLALVEEQKARIPLLETGTCILSEPGKHPCLIDIPNPFGS